MTPGDYFSIRKTQFMDTARASEALVFKTIMIGSSFVRMEFVGRALVPTFFNAFQHLEIEIPVGQRPALTLYFWESGDTAEVTPWQASDEDHLGFVDSFSCDGYVTLRQPGSGAIYTLNTNDGEFLYSIPSRAQMPWWESDFPLRMVFHWWFRNSPLQPVHAAAIGTSAGGVMLVGKGGSGKSTTALACIHSSLKVAGDDYVLLDCAKQVVYSLFSLSKVTLKSAKLLKNLNLDTSRLPAVAGDKYRVELFPDFRDGLITQIPIVAILKPVVTENETSEIVPASESEIMLALAPTTLMQLPGLREESFAKMASFVKSVPGYKLLLGKDISELPVLLENFISSVNLSGNSSPHNLPSINNR